MCFSLRSPRELLLLGDLSSLKGREEQLARAAPLLSVPGSCTAPQYALPPLAALEALLSSLLLLTMRLTGRTPQNFPRQEVRLATDEEDDGMTGLLLR